jgi:hypothetical protein
MAEWVLFQNEENSDRMGAAAFTTGPYIEMVISPLTPMTPTIEDGVVTWRVPLGEGATMSFRDNFTGFWNVWKHGIITRDYALLDEIHPNRIRSAEEWFRREDRLGRELGRGSLWDRVQPENWTADSAIRKSSADFRTGKL